MRALRVLACFWPPNPPFPSPLAIGAGGTWVEVIRLPTADAIEPLVLSLDPLSGIEARRLADAYGARNAQAFWDTVADGGYTFMATGPLDLEWMVRLWNEKQSLGTFCELIEFNVQNRLTELNPSYLTAGVALSQDRLREGVENLAAAAKLSGRAYVATGPLPTVRADEVAPIAVLSGWSPNDVAQLLASAIFDEATYGHSAIQSRRAAASNGESGVSGSATRMSIFCRPNCRSIRAPMRRPTLRHPITAPAPRKSALERPIPRGMPRWPGPRR